MKRVSLIAILALLTACTPSSVPEKQKYSLNLPATERLAVHPKPVTLQVMTMTAAPAYQYKDMIYVEKDFQLKSFAHNQWAAPPAQMMTTLLVESLRNSGIVASVISPMTASHANFRLVTQLISLTQRFQEKSCEVEVVLTAQIIRVKNRKPIGAERFVLHEPCVSNDPYGGVLAANRVVQQAMGKVVKMSQRLLRRQSQ